MDPVTRRSRAFEAGTGWSRTAWQNQASLEARPDQVPMTWTWSTAKRYHPRVIDETLQKLETDDVL